jgi:hypothetical protein
VRAARLDAFARELDDKPQLLLPEQRLDRAHDPHLAADLQALADLQRPLALQMAGCDHLIAAAQLVAIRDRPQTPVTIGVGRAGGTDRIRARRGEAATTMLPAQ